jgi:hypothetical protein
VCRRKMRMSGLCKVEMSAFMEGRGPYGNGANHFEPTENVKECVIETKASMILDFIDGS